MQHIDILEHSISYTLQPPVLQGLWDETVWQGADVLFLDAFRPESGDHRPRTQCKLLYDRERLYGLFQVADRYVRCVHRGFQAEVYKDSCVEMFIRPIDTDGYFNFEFNAGGALLASYVTDPTRVNSSVRACTPLGPDDVRKIGVYHSLPDIIEPEIDDDVVWFLEFSIPFAIMERFTGCFGDVAGKSFRANFYKCGNETSHPHWAAWSPITALNFHLPECFGIIHFEPSAC
ncbi:MAG: hypothetical protein CSYNP_02927 [Syntrophus sp. SKADARSKE-3]|nr:hypothetical protein [Syntrophus sp. SKADARSKE-3]